MTRAAIFVDAGYLFAQGSVALTGSKQPRVLLSLNIDVVLAELTAAAAKMTNNCDLLRVYWYDGASTKGPTLEQQTLAHKDSLKLRLGFINSSGQQKGVDSLIVTDLIDLARNHAICDAVLLSGDEDVRVGVQIAQQFGVRVHLLGITPARGSQSRTLQQEVDTTAEWDKPVIQKFLVVSPAVPVATPAAAAKSAATAPKPGKTAKSPATALPGPIQTVITDFIATLTGPEIETLKKHFAAGNKGVPSEYDGRLLAKSRDSMKRDLTDSERRQVRETFKTTVIAK